MWRAAADMALDEMDPAACEQVVSHLPSGLYEASPADNREQSTSWSTSSSGWGATDGSTDGTWPSAQPKPVTKTELLDKINVAQDQFREELVRMKHDDDRSAKVRQFLAQADQLRQDVQNATMTFRDALIHLHDIKVWSRKSAWQEYEDRHKAAYVNATLRPSKMLRRSAQVVDRITDDEGRPLNHDRT